MSAGKGDTLRPVDGAKYRANYDAIFRKTPPYPDWICRQCGFSYGRLPDGRLIATYHQDTCGICGKTTSVTEPRDFGHLKKWPILAEKV